MSVNIFIVNFQMDMQHSEQGHIIEVCGDLQVQERTAGANKICDGAPCGFSDAKSSPKEAKERSDSMRNLVIAVALCIVFMTVEVVRGLKAKSLAILTDAAHLLSDVAAFAISLFSLWASGWEATPRQSYGFFRIEILGALVSIQMIWLLAGILVYEAISRFFYETGEVQGFPMFLVSAFGLVVNIMMAVLLGHDHDHGHGHGHGGHDHSDTNEHNHEHTDDMHTHGMTIKTQVVSKAGHSKHDKIYHHALETDPTIPLLGPSSEFEGEHNKQKKHVQGAYLHVLGDSIQSIGVMNGGAII